MDLIGVIYCLCDDPLQALHCSEGSQSQMLVINAVHPQESRRLWFRRKHGLPSQGTLTI